MKTLRRLSLSSFYYYYWTLILSICITITTCDSQSTYQGMSPTRLLFESGKTLELNCSLPEDRHATAIDGYNSSQILFQFNGKVWPSENVTVIDDHTAMLRVQAVQRVHSGLWSCVLPGNILVRRQEITVADLPVKPNITECIVYNWESMTCTWEPKKQDTGIETNQTLYWTLLGPGEYQCPRATNFSCTWPRTGAGQDNMRPDFLYKMYVKAKNSLGYTLSKIFKAWSNSSSVKPNHVQSMKRSDVGPYHVLLSWISPAKSKGILYNIKYKEVKTHSWKEMNVTSKIDNVAANISRLLPYRDYIFKIKCIPFKEKTEVGFWSDPVNITVKTSMGVPTAAPGIAVGGFRITDNPPATNKRMANIFWKTIPEEHRSGVIRKYRVRYRVINSMNMLTVVTDGDPNRAGLSLKKNETYEVFVDAATDVGYNETLANMLTPIIIEKASALPPKPRKVVAIGMEKNLVSMNWTIQDGAVGYTVYWCQGSSHFWECDGEIDWISLDGNTTSCDINLGDRDYTYFIFGVSAEFEHNLPDSLGKDRNRARRFAPKPVVSSGLKWSECTHPLNETVVRPQKVKFSDHQKAESISLEWKHPKCDETAYIEKYIISYCPTTDCPGDSFDDDQVETVFVDNELEDFTITKLRHSVEYKVWMQSSSPYGLSDKTDVQVITVRQSGLSKGAIAGISIAGILSIFFIIFGLCQSVRTCRKTVKEKVNVKIERPPEVGNHFAQRLQRYEEGYDADYMQNYNTLLTSEPPVTRDKGDHTPTEVSPPNGTPGHVYFMNGSFQNRNSSYGMGGIDSFSSNDTTLTLLQHPSADSYDDVFDSGRGPSLEESHNSRPQLTSVPEEDTEDGLWLRPSYEKQTSGVSQHSSSTIPGYSRCGLPDEDRVVQDNGEPVSNDSSRLSQPTTPVIQEKCTEAPISRVMQNSVPSQSVDIKPIREKPCVSDSFSTTDNGGSNKYSLSPAATSQKNGQHCTSEVTNDKDKLDIGDTRPDDGRTVPKVEPILDTVATKPQCPKGGCADVTLDSTWPVPIQQALPDHELDSYCRSILSQVKSPAVSSKNNNNGYVSVNM